MTSVCISRLPCDVAVPGEREEEEEEEGEECTDLRTARAGDVGDKGHASAHTHTHNCMCMYTLIDKVPSMGGSLLQKSDTAPQNRFNLI